MTRSRSQHWLLGILALASVLFSGCGYGNQSALNNAGVQSERLGFLWWLFLAITAVVYVVVMALLIVAFFQVRRAGANADPEIKPDPARERRVGKIIKIAVGVTAITLVALMIISFRAGRAIDTLHCPRILWK